MTLFHAASRDALAAAEQKLLEVLGAAGRTTRRKPTVSAEQVGDELFAVVRMLDGEPGLRRAFGDSSAEPTRREELLDRLLSGKVGDPTRKVLATVVTSRWSTPRELVDGLDELGRTSLLVHAEREGRLDTVEDDLFRFGRIVAADGELERALANRTAPAEAKRGLVAELLGDRADAVSVALVTQLVTTPRGRSLVTGLGELASEAARRRERSVAYVIAPVPLTEQQEQRLVDTLTRVYSRPIALHVEVDPEIKGGLVVKVGDEVIDGSVTGRLDELRRRLAG
ncbi:F0F1 ATP synthase subunit delta [Actinophytocola oryzae]|uniref:ATP synthase subunit delta n=1 Tax=Actinophytocola oryzae TaxID=502181 RepID=A0A4R7VVE8_9PSEU|nr:F0F1 ATP synthase subunit delta [Actinophytocola oryzae]TDV53993.1 ATP synthase F1 subcomplex delta subunit [Actinophytocola oryzae]